MTFEVGIVLKGTLILGAAALLARSLSRTSASVRHGVWAAALAALLILPAASWTLPSFDLPLLPPVTAQLPTNVEVSYEVFAGQPTPQFAASTEVVESPIPQSRPQPRTWKTWASWVWGLGAVVVLIRVVNGARQLRSLRRRSSTAVPREWSITLEDLKGQLGVYKPIELRVGGDTVPPMTWGTWRPVILLPAGAEQWSETRVRLVMAHELAHVKRNDGLTQILAQVVWSLYWFNPAVWYANHRLRMERERACDDYVLNLGARADDYADHLLQIARGINFSASFATLSAAHPSQLESRLLAILDSRTRRQALSRLASAGLFVCIAILATVVAAMQVTAMSSMVLPALAGPAIPAMPGFAQTQTPGVLPAATTSSDAPGSIEGIVVDESGTPLADRRLGYAGKTRGTTTTDDSGKFLIKDLPPGPYRFTPETTGYVQADTLLRMYPGPNVTVGPGERIRNIRIPLVRAGAISGRVTNEHGEPLSGVQVYLVSPSYSGAGEGPQAAVGPGRVTDDRGEYRLSNVIPGRYKIKTSSRTPLPSFLPVYYPGVAMAEDAVEIAVGPGADVRGIDVAFPRFSVYDVKVKIVPGQWPVKDAEAHFTVRPIGRDKSLETFADLDSEVRGNGSFLLHGFRPGSYELGVSWGDYASNFLNASALSLLFNVTVVDRDVDAGTIVIPPSKTVRGRVTVAAGTAQGLSEIALMLTSFGKVSNTRVPMAEDGSFVVGNLPEGRYIFSAGAIKGPPLFVSSARYGGRDIVASGLLVEGEPAGPLEIVVAQRSATVNGTVRDVKDRPLADVQVALIPLGARRGDPDAFSRSFSDQAGSFSFENLPAGDYEVLAWDYAIPYNAYKNAAFREPFEKFASKVTLGNGATTSIRVRAVTMEK